MTRTDRPVLSPGSRVVRQVEDGETRFVVRAGAGGRYLRVGPAEAALLELMDGTRTVREIRTSFTARQKENIAEGEIASFVAQMRKMEVVDPTPEGRNLLLVEKARAKRRERLQTGNLGALFFWRVKLLDPDAFLGMVEPWTRWIFTRGFLAFAALLVASAAGVLVARADEVFANVSNFLLIGAGSGMGFLAIWVTALGIVFLHECGHGIACKHWGGEVHEVGFLLMFFQPCFYCNVNDAWTFESRAARLWVTAAGGFVEVLLGSTCVLIWAATEQGSAIHGFTYLVFMLSLSGTLLFNLNPLVKLDGYYLFADLVRVENLRDRSMAQVAWLVKTRILGMPGEPATALRKEAWILGVYGFASLAYQTLLVLGILALLVGAATGEGGAGFLTLCLMGFLLWMLVKKPVAFAKEGVMKGLAAATARWGGRGLALRAGGIAGGLLVLSLVIPWTLVAGAGVTAEPVRTAEIRAPLDGRVTGVAVREGERVAAGARLATLDAPESVALARIDREKADRMRRDALGFRSRGDAPAAEVREREARAAEIRARETEEGLAARVLASPFDGVVLTRRPADLEGCPVKKGDAFLKVGDLSRLRFRALLDARAVGPVREGQEAEVRVPSLPGTRLEGKVVLVSRGPVEEKDPRLAKVTGPHWEVVVETGNPEGRVLPGMTGEVRVRLERTTVAGAIVRGFRGTVRTEVVTDLVR